MATVLDLILPQHATDFVRELFTASHTGLPLERYFPVRTVGTIKVRLRIDTRTVVPALYRVYDAETPVGKRPAAVAVNELTLPPLGTKLRLSEEDQHMLLAGGTTDPIVDLLYNDLETITRGIVATLEIARGDLLNDGVMALPIEGGLKIDVDFQTPSTHRPTAAILWDAASPVPLSDEIGWLQTLATDMLGFGVPVEAVVSTKGAALLARSAEYRGAYFGGSTNVASVLNRSQLASVRDSYGLPPLTINDEIIAGVRVLPDNKMFLIPSDLGQTQMGPTMEARNLTQAGNIRLQGIDVPGLTGVIQADGDPPALWTKVAAVGMPVLNDPNRFFAATVST